ncbi:class I SAM-dependent methyltransferase [Nocardia asteroides]|uniref:class I SAM-dependent methyltransferase n=1 Tax=Nocardia asteroides TaxID=1824 RepID=UPI001E32AAFE|nr:class I SAM-dependent methyltransferase [Nocardia asteroides]UGT63090.1 class I SAM-dependent methyltransferase [Nocardia asteroides]
MTGSGPQRGTGGTQAGADRGDGALPRTPGGAEARNFLTDNPALYEAKFPDHGHLAARFVHETVERFGGGRGLLDLGCGTGRDAGYLAGIGYTVTGLDSSDAMLRHARKAHPAATFVHGDLREFQLGARFDIITCLDSALLYCHTNAELAGFLRHCAGHLAPNGLLIAEMRNGAFFLGSTELLDTTSTRALTRDGATYHSHTTLRIDHSAQLLRRSRTWTLPDGAALHQESAWRLLFPQELRYFLDVAGFDVLALFDGPGPRTDPVWEPGAAPSADAASGDRLHLVARLRAAAPEGEA